MLEIIKRNIRIVNLINAVLYIIVFRQVYVNYLAEYMAHYTYRVANDSTGAVLITNVIALIPIFIYKCQNRVSDFISIFIYVFVFVPTIVGIQYYYEDYSFVIPYQLSYLFGMILFFRAGSNRISKGHFPPVKKGVNFKYFVYFAFFIISVIVIFYHGRLRLVSFSDVYELRGESAQLNLGIIGYFIMWINSFSPLMIAIGCLKNNKKILILGFALALVYYMFNAMKAIVFIALISYGLYHFFKRYGLTYVFIILTFVLYLCYSMIAFLDNESINMAVSITLNRSYGISAQIAPMYIDVFQKYPHTYYSHIRAINAITGMYPFGDLALGTAVEQIICGTDGLSNTNFMATDGIAAMGVPGVFFISIVFYYLLSYLNKVTNNYEFYFSASVLFGVTLELSNMSIFTTLLSSGLIILIVFFRYGYFAEKK